jgi:hypothetical protein
LGRAFGLGPYWEDLFFFETIFQRKNKFGNSRKCLQCTKNTPKITKIPEKFLETHWDMNNPNKVFGDHEKDFRAS